MAVPIAWSNGRIDPTAPRDGPAKGCADAPPQAAAIGLETVAAGAGAPDWP